jgi:hypothetical protein
MIKLIQIFTGILIFTITLPLELLSQENDTSAEFLQKQELLLTSYFDSLAGAESDEERIRMNQRIVEIFREVIKHQESFGYSFDSIDQAGILLSPDKKVKFYNWNLPFDNGLHEYFCFVQYKPEKKSDTIYHYELKDKSDSIDNPEEAILNFPKWYGSLYYKIIPIETRFDETYYTLLALDLNDYLTNKKIVDILRFNENNQPVFGATIFKNRKKVTNRLIFEYSEFATMTLKYIEDKEMIVYDHLSPSSPKYEGQREFYGPDFSYDGLKYEKGIWNTYYDLDLRLNKINLND